MLLISLLGILILCFLFYLKKVYSYWEKRNVPTPAYNYIFGNLFESVVVKKAIYQIYAKIYEDFKGYNYVGIYKFMLPGILIRDPDLVKEILQTSFHKFRDNDVFVDENVDLVMGKNPFATRGDHWKKVRGQISSSFSVSKTKTMFPLMLENCKKMKDYLESSSEAKNDVGLELKEFSSKYTSENVASCAFGLNGMSFEDPNSKFREIGRKLTHPTFINALKHLVILVLPSLATSLKIKFFSDEATEFLKQTVRSTIKYRKENNIVRNDFIDTMTSLRAKINDEKDFNENDIVAHAGGFFADGFETSSIVISYALYELADNLDVQDKLRKEIDEVIDKYNGEFTFEAIQDMKYLEMVIKETLRLRVPAGAIVRISTESFQLPPLKEDNTGPTPVLEPGLPVVIPVLGFHKDETFFPEPNRFNPERFSEENIDNIVKYTYLPFGEGPRMCLGMQFGLLQTKLGIAYLIKHFEIRKNKKTLEPLECNPEFFMMAAKGGIWANFYKRNINK